MTVICYRKGILAADSQTTDDTGMILNLQKIFELPNRTVVASAGDADCREVLHLLGKATLNRMPTRKALLSTTTAFQGIWVFPGCKPVFRVSIEHSDSWTAEIIEILDDWAVAGTGGSYAAGAILAGKSAIEAVRIACKLDANCGLPVRSVKIPNE